MSRPMLYVDNRHSGNHGIARYASEVLSRLTLPRRELSGEYRRPSPIDVVDRARMRLPRQAVLYNPGYSTGLARCTQLITLHDLTHLRVRGPRAQVNRLYYDKVVRPAIVKAGHVVTVSETSARDIRDWLGNDAVTVHNAGNGCSDVFSDAVGEPADFGRPYFVYVGNFKEHKNPVPLFRAMRAFPDHLLVVVTGDSYAAEELARGSGVFEQIALRSNITDEELRAIYRGAEALVFPSTWEGFGLPVLEALKCGTSVVYSSSAQSVAEICEDSQFPVEDPSSEVAFAAAMTAAASAPFAAPPNLGNHTWDAVAAGVQRAIVECMSGRSGR